MKKKLKDKDKDKDKEDKKKEKKKKAEEEKKKKEKIEQEYNKKEEIARSFENEIREIINKFLSTKSGGEYPETLKNIVYHLQDKLLEDILEMSNSMFGDFTTIFKVGVLIENVLLQKNIILKNLSNLSPSIFERLNDFYNYNPKITLNEDYCNGTVRIHIIPDSHYVKPEFLFFRFHISGFTFFFLKVPTLDNLF